MLEDVLEAIGAARSIERTIVVSSEPRAVELARRSGAEVLADPDEGGHSGAALAGIARARELGAELRRPAARSTARCSTPRELERLLTGMPERYVAIVPDRHGTGTNALALAPPDAIEPSFGEGSCARHVAAAREAGIPFGGRGAALAGARPRHPGRRRRPHPGAGGTRRPAAPRRLGI